MWCELRKIKPIVVSFRCCKLPLFLPQKNSTTTAPSAWIVLPTPQKSKNCSQNLYFQVFVFFCCLSSENLHLWRKYILAWPTPDCGSFANFFKGQFKPLLAALGMFRVCMCAWMRLPSPLKVLISGRTFPRHPEVGSENGLVCLVSMTTDDITSLLCPGKPQCAEYFGQKHKHSCPSPVTSLYSPPPRGFRPFSPRIAKIKKSSLMTWPPGLVFSPPSNKTNFRKKVVITHPLPSYVSLPCEWYERSPGSKAYFFFVFRTIWMFLPYL